MKKALGAVLRFPGTPLAAPSVLRNGLIVINSRIVKNRRLAITIGY